jgi:hypothetical protein
MSGPYRVSGKSGRVAMYCETCGKVDGPLPFGRGEIALTMTTDGAYCQDHMPKEVRHDLARVDHVTPSVNRVMRTKKPASADIQLVLDFIRTL